jgi:DNA-binding NarL/FixJ family response regulator
LYNRNLPDLAAGKLPGSLRRRAPGLPAFAFGIYEQSDDIFITLTGVNGGYFLRRRAPMEMLEPVQGAWRNGQPSLEQVNHHIRRYFQGLLAHSPEANDAAVKANLTHREHEILDRLSKGYIDKEIADALKISAWTVHNHLKNIFKKLDVHTRTEAAIRYLEK